MAFCSSCGKPVSEDSTFCPECGNQLLEPKPKSWFERHLNWTMVLAWAGASVITIIAAVADPTMSEDALYGLSIIFVIAVSIPVGWWVLRKKNRSLAWLLICWTIFFLLIGNKSGTQEQRQ